MLPPLPVLVAAAPYGVLFASAVDLLPRACRRRPRAAPRVEPGSSRGARVDQRVAPERDLRGDLAARSSRAGSRRSPKLRHGLSPTSELAALLALAEELALRLAFLFGEDVDAGEVHDVLGLVEQRGDVGVELGRIGSASGSLSGRERAVLPTRRRSSCARTSGSRPGNAHGASGARSSTHLRTASPLP